MDGVSRAAALDELAGSLRERLLARADEAGQGAAVDVHAGIRELVEREAALLDPADREALVARVAERSFGLGPLEPLLRDPEVDEIMVNGTAPVWVERAGRLERTDACFASEAELRHAIERILAPLGRRADEAEPLCDARPPGGICAARDGQPLKTASLLLFVASESGSVSRRRRPHLSRCGSADLIAGPLRAPRPVTVGGGLQRVARSASPRSPLRASRGRGRERGSCARWRAPRCCRWPCAPRARRAADLAV